MSYKVMYDKKALKTISKLDETAQKKIKKYITEVIEKLDNPRSQGKALVGKKYKGKWRYRVGDYRILAQILDEKIIVYIFDVGHRKEIYK